MGLSSPEKRFSWATITDQKLPSGVADFKCVKFWPKWPLFFWCCHSFTAWFLIPARLAQSPAERRERCWGSLNCPAFGVCLSVLPSPWESSPAQRPQSPRLPPRPYRSLVFQVWGVVIRLPPRGQSVLLQGHPL